MAKRDINETAFFILEQVTGENPIEHVKNESAVALGRLGGLRGGKARADKLTPERRKEIAQKAAAKRWGKKD
ncbi:histone H1 [Mucilaginibacter gilvus]|uniref:Histone H1 n=1 Tax=Mucilaginibacter gilvus TaxID=2305909 RepID=A0A3S3V2D2_9SPHI|nr:histone H1 [Mucilaginibacter gilvus]RWY53955.1 histone H1 [Mucilaginibacter gilvus]